MFGHSLLSKRIYDLGCEQNWEEKRPPETMRHDMIPDHLLGAKEGDIFFLAFLGNKVGR